MKKYALLLLLAFIVAAASGGCGGSNSGSVSSDSTDSQQTDDNSAVPSAVPDSDGDGVPDIFNYYTAGYSDGRNAPNNGAAYDVPYLNYVSSSDLDENGELETKVYLTQGREYVFKYSRSGRVLGDNDLEFRVFTPDDKEILFDLGLASDPEAGEPAAMTLESQDTVTSGDAGTALPEGEEEAGDDEAAEQEYLTVDARLEILPVENPCMIYYTFTAPQTGIFTFLLREKEYAPTSRDVPFEVRIYRSDDTSALTLNGITMTSRDMLDIQRVLLNNAEEFNSDGVPVSFNAQFISDDVYGQMLQDIEKKNELAASIRASAGGGARIESAVDNVPYHSLFDGGRGYYAHSGRGAPMTNAFENFVLPRPTDSNTEADAQEYWGYKEEFRLNKDIGSWSMTPFTLVRETYTSPPTKYSFSYIATEEEHDREQELKSMSSFALVQNAIGEAPITALNVRAGNLTKTVMVNYEAAETKPRLVNINNLKFNEDASYLLDSPNTFREEYGDYFVAGYTWGIRFKASISVTSVYDADVNRVCNDIKALMDSAANGTYNTDAAGRIQYAAGTSYLDISIEQMRVEGGIINKTMPTSVSDVARELIAFRNRVQSVSRSSLVPLRVSMRRFREIPAAKSKIPELLPISQSHFDAVKEMTRSIFRARMFYNAMMAVNTSHLQNGNGMKNSWQQDFEEGLDSIRNAFEQVCNNESQANRIRNIFQNQYNKYRALSERYGFYRRLVEEKSKQPRGFSDTDADHDGYVEGGFYSYSQSSTVAGDYSTKVHELNYCEGAKAFTTRGWHVWGSQTDWRYVWLKTGWRNTNNSDGSDEAYPTVGSRKLDWEYEGGYHRRAEWYNYTRCAHMPDSKYPFVGL